MRQRPSARIPKSVDFEKQVFDAFAAGDPALVYQVTQQLLEKNRELSQYAAQLRFEVNFGSELCERCEGLRAGPGVVATCYQVRECNFTNIKEVPHDPKKLRVLQGLLNGQPIPRDPTR